MHPRCLQSLIPVKCVVVAVAVSKKCVVVTNPDNLPRDVEEPVRGEPAKLTEDFSFNENQDVTVEEVVSILDREASNLNKNVTVVSNIEGVTEEVQSLLFKEEDSSTNSSFNNSNLKQYKLPTNTMFFQRFLTLLGASSQFTLLAPSLTSNSLSLPLVSGEKAVSAAVTESTVATPRDLKDVSPTASTASTTSSDSEDLGGVHCSSYDELEGHLKSIIPHILQNEVKDMHTYVYGHKKSRYVIGCRGESQGSFVTEEDKKKGDDELGTRLPANSPLHEVIQRSIPGFDSRKHNLPLFHFGNNPQQAEYIKNGDLSKLPSDLKTLPVFSIGSLMSYKSASRTLSEESLKGRRGAVAFGTMRAFDRDLPSHYGAQRHGRPLDDRSRAMLNMAIASDACPFKNEETGSLYHHLANGK